MQYKLIDLFETEKRAHLQLTQSPTVVVLGLHIDWSKLIVPHFIYGHFTIESFNLLQLHMSLTSPSFLQIPYCKHLHVVFDVM